MQMAPPSRAVVGAGMTTRNTLHGWFRFLWVGILAVGVLAGSWQATWDNHVFREAVLGFLLLSVVGVFAFGFRCPRCRSSLATRAAIILSGRPCECPKCGMNVDEPRDTAGASK
jgi:hypothetical protein